jgi:hypothetical protein
MKFRSSVCFLFAVASLYGVRAQNADSSAQTGSSTEAKPVQEQIDELKGSVDGINESYLGTKSDVEKMKKIKVSGYLQAQMRMATDTLGNQSSGYSYYSAPGEFQGGKFPNGSRAMFQLRRARIKIGYESDLSQMYVQFDCLPFTTGFAENSITQASDTSKKVSVTKAAFLAGGGVTIKDAYLRFTEPWLKSIAVKAGIYDRPFGYEISYSSSNRESPERSRLFQTLFPGERDLGVSMEYIPADGMPKWAQIFNIKAGAFAGNGINVDYDARRDFIGRFGLALPITSANMEIDGGFSAYVGQIKNYSDTVYKYDATAKKMAPTAVSKSSEPRVYEARQYFGGDLQYYFGNIPLFGGITLRGEVIGGQQPALKGNSGSPKTDYSFLNNTGSSSTKYDPLYVRNFLGFYAMAVLNLDFMKSQLVGKFDLYDPNTDCSGNDVTNLTDLAYKTLGGGLVFHWDENVKFILYYDRVMNEKTTGMQLAAGLPKDFYNSEVNDDILTFRIQYKF